MTNSGVKIQVSGRVQGVGFRYFTFQQARKLNLTGYVYNLADGRVEIVACGRQQDIDALLKWLEQGGPPSAKITHFSTHPYSGESYSKFEIEH